jgi:hypothetical protein
MTAAIGLAAVLSFTAARADGVGGLPSSGPCDSDNCSAIQQYGDYNNASTDQSGDANRAIIQQVGSYNTHSIGQTGTGNLAGIAVASAPGAPSVGNVGAIVQNGAGNLAIMAMAGSRNNFAVTQGSAIAGAIANYATIGVLGSDNQVTQTQSGTGNVVAALVNGNANKIDQGQAGNFNNMALAVDGSNNTIALSQTGNFNNMAYAIHADNLLPGDLPVVSQTGGTPGAPPVLVTVSGGGGFGLVTPTH